MNYLIDTNIISEIRKGPRCNDRVASWYAAVKDTELYLSVLVIGEVRKGIESARRRDSDKAQTLEKWLEQVKSAFGDRILPIDDSVGDEWGRMSTIRSIPVVDALLAATAKIHGMTLVTRNAKDVADLGAMVLNPFEI